MARLATRSDEPDKTVLDPDGKLDRYGTGTETLLDLLDHPEKIGSNPVHLVDVGNARHTVLIRLPPNRLGLGLDAFHRAEHGDAPSGTRNDRSSSTVKSTWPGVSIMLMRQSRHWVVVRQG